MDLLLKVIGSWILPALFFWFLFSFIAMIAIEFIQRFMKSRQKGLEEVLEKLLGKDLTEDFYKHALVNPLEDKKPSYISQSLFAKVVMEWMLKETKVEKPKKKDTVDVSTSLFFKVVLDWMLKKTQAAKSEAEDTLNEIIQKNIRVIVQKDAEELGEVLQTIVNQADVKTDKDSEFLDLVQKDLEAWFNEAVGQMSSVYGTRLQLITILVSLAVAAISNFDVIDITVRLWETSKYNELLAFFEKKELSLLIDKNLFLMLPVGWYSNYLPSTPAEWILKIIGIYLGAFFIAIGSQFAFNLTKKQYRPRE